MADTILQNARTVDEILSDILEPIIGDTPVSVQLALALEQTASKEDMSKLRSDLNALRKDVESLIELVGDTAVSVQIGAALETLNKTTS